ncbi:MAG: amidohydrolase family protein [Thermoplasmata archaeon]
MGVTDCHVHINPLWEMRPEVRALMGDAGPAAEVERYLRDPGEFLSYLDRCEVERAVLINYVSPEVVGYTERANDFVLDYCRGRTDRLLAVGGVAPEGPDPAGAVERLHRAGLRGIKLHPPHQLFEPNGYLNGRIGLRELYTAAERLGLPVIFHTGTSVFPRARSRFGQPLLVEDVAIDFPRLTIVLAHGGRPIWMNEAVYLARRFPNVYLEISSVPPARLLLYFPDLGRLSEKVLFGSDWPGPGVRDISENLRGIRSLPLPPEAVTRILEENPRKVFPDLPGTRIVPGSGGGPPRRCAAAGPPTAVGPVAVSSAPPPFRPRLFKYAGPLAGREPRSRPHRASRRAFRGSGDDCPGRGRCRTHRGGRTPAAAPAPSGRDLRRG